MSLPATLQRLQDESIHIFRAVVAECRQPVMLYSIGKDSSVLLHLACKAFAPSKLPFPLLHIDTGWKFPAMLAFRDETARRLGLDLMVHTNEDGRRRGINPFDHGPYYTDVMKTQALKQALDAGGWDAAFGGARRDEDASRAKERIVSVRSASHEWDPQSQRPEFWNLFNTRVRPGEHVRVFPLSNWTERDIWNYIAAENIPVVDLYFAREHALVQRNGTLISRQDDRLQLEPGETVQHRLARFRTLGCYPLTGAICSTATTVADIIAELPRLSQSERGGRLIDRDQPGAMERKKREGYF